MKVITVVSFIIVVLGITFYIRSPYIHVAFFEGPIEHQKDNTEQKPRSQIDPSPVINQTSQHRIKINESISEFPLQSTSLSSEPLLASLRGYKSDMYRVDAIEELVSQLSQNLSGDDLLSILGLFESDMYRVDAISALRSQLKPIYSNSDLGRISQLFTSESYRTDAFAFFR